MKLYAHPDKYMTKKMLIAANYAGLDIEIPKNAGADEVGRIPVLETEGGCIFSTGAIARYLSRLRRDVPLYGRNLLESGMIDSWTEFSTNELEVPLSAWMNHAQYPAEVVERAKADALKALGVLNNHLLNFTYMVGDSMTLADISVCCAVAEAFKTVLTADVRSSLGNLVRWFNLCMAQTEFQKVIGKVDMAAGGAAAPAAKGKADKGSPKAAPKTEAAPKKAAAAKPEAKKAAAPAAAGAPASEDAIKAVGDAIRELKEKLKAEGVSGKKLNDHPEVTALVKQLSDMKAGAAAAPAASSPKSAPKAAPAKKEEKKDDKKSDPVADRKALMKKVVKEGGKRGVEIEGAADMGGLQFFCTAVEFPDGDLEMLRASLDAMNEKSDPTEEERKGGSGNIGKMIFSCGTQQLAVAAYVPEAKQGELVCKEWLEKVVSMFPGGKVTSSAKDVCIGIVPADGDKNIFPLKIREPMILEANNFLRKKGLFPEDKSDSDEMVFGDDDFPSM